MRLRKLIVKIHQWLGLVSGLLVFLISISGVIYTFHEEIFNTVHKESIYIEPSDNPVLPLDTLYHIVQQELGENYPVSFVYVFKDNDLAWQFRAYKYNSEGITYFSWCEYDFLVYVNPYTGEVLKRINHKYEFFQLVKMFHWSFLFRTEIGQPIVGWSVVVFLLVLLSGVIWWWPRKNKFKKRHFTIRWRSNIYVINRDLHVVTGIFGLPVIVLLSLTGMVWAFKWFMALVYIAANLSFQTPPGRPVAQPVEGNVMADVYETIYQQSRALSPEAYCIAVNSVNDQSNTIAVFVKNRSHVYYDSRRETWDATTGELLIHQSYDTMNRGEKVVSMNYDIHTGAVLGIWGKVVVFLAGLIAAALPVTGFIAWYKKYRRQV